ncbi:hypothetical protein BpHYR1_022782 [Brachionus plicatilis]|uniref:Uncharacterized protein n=1 Tax=Brachionus plicatilis TaxID=10195 RepID=A0A3M7QKU5_BRAPC|nr:hypothetical protein BpHYR1_022782 [Brachionus plicatilis]
MSKLFSFGNRDADNISRIHLYINPIYHLKDRNQNFPRNTQLLDALIQKNQLNTNENGSLKRNIPGFN